ncbi:hypothetical protein ACTXN3_12650, partial [Corynebacterium flavescens]
MSNAVNAPALSTAGMLRQILGIVSLDGLKDVSEEDKWIMPGLVNTTNTLIYGQASSGKSMVIASILASLIDGRDFLGITPLKSGFHPLVICADRGAELEYKERLANLGIGSGIEFMPGVGVLDQDSWELLHE